MIWCKAWYYSAVSISRRKFNKIKREKELLGLLSFIGVIGALVQMVIMYVQHSCGFHIGVRKRKSSTYDEISLSLHRWQFLHNLKTVFQANAKNSATSLSTRFNPRALNFMSKAILCHVKISADWFSRLWNLRHSHSCLTNTVSLNLLFGSHWDVYFRLLGCFFQPPLMWTLWFAQNSLD